MTSGLDREIWLQEALDLPFGLISLGRGDDSSSGRYDFPDDKKTGSSSISGTVESAEGSHS